MLKAGKKSGDMGSEAGGLDGGSSGLLSLRKDNSGGFRSGERLSSSAKGNLLSKSSATSSKDRVSRSKKRERQFVKSTGHQKAASNRIFNVVIYRQRFRAMTGAVWTMKFNKSGRYLATAGEEPVVKLWKVMPGILESLDHMDEAEQRNFFEEIPVRVYTGHTKPIVNMDWSTENFLLTSSMDHTVRLWHSARSECLKVFQHADVVSAVVFHPLNNTTFLSCSFNGSVQLWSLLSSSPLSAVHAEDYVSCAEITRCGKHAIIGTVNGHVKFYSMRNEITRSWKLKDITQVDIRPERTTEVKINSESGTKRNLSKKVSGIVCSPSGTEMLITTNDSHLRLHMLNDKSIKRLFRGHVGGYNSFRGTFSDDERFLLCPSDHRSLSIWERNETPSTVSKGKNRAELVTAYESITLDEDKANPKDSLTAALFAPPMEEEDPLHMRSRAADRDYVIVTASHAGFVTVLQSKSLVGEIHL